MIATAAELRAPHRLTHAAQDLAARFHRFYTECRVVGEDERSAAGAAVALAGAAEAVLANLLGLLGVRRPSGWTATMAEADDGVGARAASGRGPPRSRRRRDASPDPATRARSSAHRAVVAADERSWRAERPIAGLARLRDAGSAAAGRRTRRRSLAVDGDRGRRQRRVRPRARTRRTGTSRRSGSRSRPTRAARGDRAARSWARRSRWARDVRRREARAARLPVERRARSRSTGGSASSRRAGCRASRGSPTVTRTRY